MSSVDAHTLDSALRAAAQSTADSLGTLADLVAQAREAEIHAALGFDSWGEYLADALAPVARRWCVRIAAPWSGTCDVRQI